MSASAFIPKLSLVDAEPAPAAPSTEISISERGSQMGENLSLDCADRGTAAGAIKRARDAARRAVALEQIDKKTAAAAVESLSRQGRFGSWLLKLHRGDKVTIHLHHYERLCDLLEQLVTEHERRLSHERMVLQATRRRDAARETDLAADQGRPRTHLRTA